MRRTSRAKNFQVSPAWGEPYRFDPRNSKHPVNACRFKHPVNACRFAIRRERVSFLLGADASEPEEPPAEHPHFPERMAAFRTSGPLKRRQY